MSFQNQSGMLSAFQEIVPEAAKVGGLTKSSLLTQRRRCRVSPQTGPSSTPSQQVQFLISDAGGLLDPRSMVLNYTLTATGTAPVCPDDGHVFGSVQVLLNGQLLDNIQNAMKVTNIESTLGSSKSYYSTAGSFQGMELLNNDLQSVALTTTALTNTTTPAFASVVNNVSSISARYTRAAAAFSNNQSGSQRSIPVGAMTGFGRCKTYIPIAILGEVSLVLQTGSAADVMFQYSATQDASYSLSNLSLEYDIVVPDARYAGLLQKVAGEDAGMTIPYESTIVATGGVISSSASALQESSIITSRATNHLLRASVVQIPQAVISSLSYPSQSAFSHAGVFSAQFRVGSLTFPQIAAQGDASLFNMSLAAYGSPTQENGSVTNRCLWAQSTNPSTAGTAASYEDAVGTSGSARFAYADRCIPSYGFATCKGGVEPLDVDGISLAGASGSQLITTLVSAPAAAYIPYVSMVALRFIRAASGTASVVGA
jgi:hypothetical protein